MTKEIWLNLPVKDINRSKEFFRKLGFSFHPRHEGSNEMAGLIVGEKNVMVMLFTEAIFKSFTQNEITDTSRSTEVLLTIDAESKEEVFELAKKAEEAGGSVFAPPGGQGGMYGCGFKDPDGHRWNVLFMEQK
ncbi:MAG: VOC family protein [Hymenobacteraceae bacterium]|nr:VOC family protein [Hymenobacteraceae bacterium]MDX5398000.1 VOC family protein [Hymenobacteraceae bacterium]MDX5443854.1 VOC family protein [Hymenobacteraceae bacterium]MDX5514072.1 VOC family protein [Hymenobacteraceae bacterium]